MTLRALISTSTFPLEIDDGLPRFVLDLARYLKDHCDVTVLAPGAPGSLLVERLAEVDVRRFDYFLPRRWQNLAYGHGMRENLRRSWITRLQPLPYVWAQARATRALALAQSIDVVNSHWLVPQGLSSALARGSSRRFGHVLSVHAADVYLLERIVFGRSLARFVAARTDWMFADGSHVRDRLDALLGRPSHAVLQPMGVDLARFSCTLDTGEPAPFADGYLVFVGRLTEKKGVAHLLRAMPRILEHHPRMGLLIIGYGPLDDELRQQAKDLGIADSLAFLGRRSHEEIASYLSRSAVAVVPSVVDRHGETDGMPTVVIEAMAAGTRVVATAVDGIPDVIRHADNGWLCREKDAEQLADAILDALADDASTGIVQRSIETASGFDWPKVAARYAEAFVASARHGGHSSDQSRPADSNRC